MECYTRSLEHYLKAHEQFSASDQLNCVAMSLNNIGNVYRMAGDATSALAYFDAVCNLYDTLQKSRSVIHVLSNKSATLLDIDELPAAQSLLEKAHGPA